MLLFIYVFKSPQKRIGNGYDRELHRTQNKSSTILSLVYPHAPFEPKPSHLALKLAIFRLMQDN